MVIGCIVYNVYFFQMLFMFVAIQLLALVFKGFEIKFELTKASLFIVLACDIISTS